MQRRTLMIAGAALTSVAFMPAALAADGLPYDAKGDPFAFVVDLSNAVLDRIRSSEALKSGNVDSLRNRLHHDDAYDRRSQMAHRNGRAKEGSRERL